MMKEKKGEDEQVRVQEDYLEDQNILPIRAA